MPCSQNVAERELISFFIVVLNFPCLLTSREPISCRGYPTSCSFDMASCSTRLLIRRAAIARSAVAGECFPINENLLPVFIGRCKKGSTSVDHNHYHGSPGLTDVRATAASCEQFPALSDARFFDAAYRKARALSCTEWL